MVCRRLYGGLTRNAVRGTHTQWEVGGRDVKGETQKNTEEAVVCNNNTERENK